MLGTLVGCARDQARAASASGASGEPEKGLVWEYEVTSTSAGIDVLEVDARFAALHEGSLSLDDEAAPFVRDLAFESGTQWVPVERKGAIWMVPCSHGCHVHYRYALREAATALADPETAIAAGGAIVAAPSTWLVRPEANGGRLRVHVAVEPPSRFTTAMAPSVNSAPGTFEIPTAALEDSSFAVWGAFDLESIENGATRATVAIASPGSGLSTSDVTRWIKTAVDSIAAYYGRALVDRVLVVVIPGSPGNPTRGETLGDGGPAVLVRAAPSLTVAATRDDWVVTHELLHVSLPALGHDHAWLSEGIATYVEPVVRARAGLVSPETFWHDLVEGLPQGLPEAGDQGLERTSTWGRTYWGGALFCLAADVAIRERTGNTRSFDDALRGIVASGADVESHWSVEQFLDLGDRSTGTNVLHDLYRTLALAPGTVDLPRMWQRLGVTVEPGHVRFDDHAPLAAVRRAITSLRE